jgi:hypothetical protein
MLDHRFAPRRALSLLALFCAICASPLSAQQPPAPAPPAGTQAPAPPGTTTETKPNYGQWWLANARDVNPQPPGSLFHVEGQGSFANSTGSISGFEYTLNALSALRRGIATNQVGVSFIIQEQRVEGQGSFKQTTARFFDILYVNVTKPLNLITAVIVEKDEPKRVLHREAVFEGLGRNMALAKGRMVGVAAAMGYENEHVLTPVGPQDHRTPTAYFQNTYSSPIAMRGLFTHHIEMFNALDNRDDFRVNWNLGLNLQVTPHIGIGPSLQIRYDAKPVVQVQKTDTMVVFGVQFK